MPLLQKAIYDPIREEQGGMVRVIFQGGIKGRNRSGKVREDRMWVEGDMMYFWDDELLKHQDADI